GKHARPAGPVRSVTGVDSVLAQQPEPKPGGAEDAENRKHAMPRDQKRSELKDVRLEVDDDGQRHHELSMARVMRVIATSFGNSASVSPMGGEMRFPVTASRIGMNTSLGFRPALSATCCSTSWMGTASHS